MIGTSAKAGNMVSQGRLSDILLSGQTCQKLTHDLRNGDTMQIGAERSIQGILPCVRVYSET